MRYTEKNNNQLFFSMFKFALFEVNACVMFSGLYSNLLFLITVHDTVTGLV